MRKFLLLISVAIFSNPLTAQYTLIGSVLDDDRPLEFATLSINDGQLSTYTDSLGNYSIDLPTTGYYLTQVHLIGYQPMTVQINIESDTTTLDFQLQRLTNKLEEIVVTGTMKAVSRLNSPVPVEVYSPHFFKKNPTPNIFEALQGVNGVRPQLNCNVCNTGDIHINGLEGPYTMVLIDGVPIVSSLASVYGLSGIPNSLIERIEIVKGPASSLYGSEAIGGLINVITKHPENAPSFYSDIMTTSWQEHNVDLGAKFRLGRINLLSGINAFHYDRPYDHNEDNFTDVTLQKRVSVFQKLSIDREDNKTTSLAARYYYEDRWGGEMNWSHKYRGGNEIYGESIFTSRWEIIGKYDLPLDKNLSLTFSYNDHRQNSVYGDLTYIAKQKIGFSQLVLDETQGAHDLLLGMTLRHTYYDDNTPATANFINPKLNEPSSVWLPGIFAQDEWKLQRSQKLLGGLRYDYHTDHGHILTPRLAYQLSIDDNTSVRLNAGTGFRVVNLFAEEHAALTGAREVVVLEDLKPEKSFNLNLNLLRRHYFNNGDLLTIDISAWYTHFSNVIIPDYETQSSQIIYDNLDGHAINKGISCNVECSLINGLTVLAGATILDVKSIENETSSRPLLTERYSGTWQLTYRLNEALSFDYTGSIYGSMKLPVLGANDPRPAKSPVWSLQNVQLTYGFNGFELYGGVKNLLDWTPNKSAAFLIARAHDPFDKDVVFDTNGQAVASPDNPYALTFDPSYVYAPNQGIRAFLGLRWTIE